MAKARIKRKTQKRYPRVVFSQELFEGEFDLPKVDSIPMGVIAGLSEGNLGKVFTFLEDNASEDAVEAISSLGQDEFQDFFEAWSNASGVDGPK